MVTFIETNMICTCIKKNHEQFLHHELYDINKLETAHKLHLLALPWQQRSKKLVDYYQNCIISIFFKQTDEKKLWFVLKQ